MQVLLLRRRTYEILAVEQLLIGVEYGGFQHAAMRRVFIAGSPLAKFGQISGTRLAQIVAVASLASLACPEMKSLAVREPNLLGLAAGANTVYAERGANPRDIEKETSANRGRDVAACKEMLFEAGFKSPHIGPETRTPLLMPFNAQA